MASASARTWQILAPTAISIYTYVCDDGDNEERNPTDNNGVFAGTRAQEVKLNASMRCYALPHKIVSEIMFDVLHLEGWDWVEKIFWDKPENFIENFRNLIKNVLRKGWVT